MKRFPLLLCLILGFAACGRAQPSLVVILLPGTGLQAWRTAAAPHLHSLMASGAMAVMNTRTARLPNGYHREMPESAALTLGAGARVAGDPDTAAFSPQTFAIGGFGVTAGALYFRRVGQRPRPDQYVNINWPTLLRANSGLGYRLRLGILADTLAAQNLRLAAGGGPDADRVASAGNGVVRRVHQQASAGQDCLIWDAGSDISAADTVIGKAAGQMAQRHGRLIVLSPYAGDNAYAQGQRLTPVLEWGAGVPAGLLRSDTTHRAGLVTNTDFAPTVGSYFGIERQQFAVWPYGHAWSVVPSNAAESQVRVLESQAVRQAQGMKILPYLAVALAAWMLGGTALAKIGRIPGLWPIVPLILVNTALYSVSVMTFFVWFALIFALAWPLAMRFGACKISLALLAVFALSLVFDMLTGSRLMQQGLLGYSAIEGARYYGVGNEAMGPLIGALLVLTARLWKPIGRTRWALLLLLGTVSLLLGSPSAGAKAGGLLVSLIAFGTLGFTLLGGRWSMGAVLALLSLVTAAMVFAAVEEAVSGQGARSHMGEAVRRIQAGGFAEAWDIVSRKFAVEDRLAYRSAWASLLWGGLLCLGWLWRGHKLQSLEDQALRIAGTAAIAACFAFNDAGVIAGALCLIPLWCDRIIGETNKKPLEQGMLFQGQPLSGRDY